MQVDGPVAAAVVRSIHYAVGELSDIAAVIRETLLLGADHALDAGAPTDVEQVVLEQLIQQASILWPESPICPAMRHPAGSYGQSAMRLAQAVHRRMI